MFLDKRKFLKQETNLLQMNLKQFKKSLPLSLMRILQHLITPLLQKLKNPPERNAKRRTMNRKRMILSLDDPISPSAKENPTLWFNSAVDVPADTFQSWTKPIVERVFPSSTKKLCSHHRNPTNEKEKWFAMKTESELWFQHSRICAFAKLPK
jgi:hypothetical protein